EADLALAELSDRNRGTVDSQRRNDDIDAAAILQTRVANRAGLVDAAADTTDDPIADIEQMGVVLERHRSKLDLAGALDIDLLGPVDHDVGDALVPEQRLEGTEAHHVVDELVDEIGLFRTIELDAGLRQQLGG